MVKGKTVKKGKSRSKTKTRVLEKKIDAAKRFDTSLDSSRDIVKSLRKENKVKVATIKKIEHITDYDIYKITGTKGKEFYLVNDYDSLQEHAIATVEDSWGDYEEAGWVDDETVTRDFVEQQGEADILANYEGVIHETEDGKPYYRFN